MLLSINEKCKEKNILISLSCFQTAGVTWRWNCFYTILQYLLYRCGSQIFTTVLLSSTELYLKHCSFIKRLFLLNKTNKVTNHYNFFHCDKNKKTAPNGPAPHFGNRCSNSRGLSGCHFSRPHDVHNYMTSESIFRE